MAFFLQSQTSGCCNAPTGTIEALPYATGILYLPAPQGTSGDGLYYCNLPTHWYITPPNSTQKLYYSDANVMVNDLNQNTRWYYKVIVTTTNNCNRSVTYFNPYNTAASAQNGIKVNYPTNNVGYTVTVYAQPAPESRCNINQPIPTYPFYQPEWKIDYPGMVGNITWNTEVINKLVETQYNTSPGTFSFKYNGLVPFGQNVNN